MSSRSGESLWIYGDLQTIPTPDMNIDGSINDWKDLRMVESMVTPAGNCSLHRSLWSDFRLLAAFATQWPHETETHET